MYFLVCWRNNNFLTFHTYEYVGVYSSANMFVPSEFPVWNQHSIWYMSSMLISNDLSKIKCLQSWPHYIVDAFPEPDRTRKTLSPHNLDLHKICGDLAGTQFRKLKSVLGLAKETVKTAPFYRDLFFNRTRRHFDDQDSDKILEFVKYMLWDF